MLRIHDTRAGETGGVTTARAVRMYTCGPRLDRPAHIGDLRPHVLSDLIRRVLESRRVRVLACRDVADLATAAGQSASLRDHEEAFGRDAAALNLLPPEHAPRAGETADAVIALIARLVERGHAYAAPDGTVYFAAAAAPDPRERSQADWPLWEPRDGDPSWDAPWGRGLPVRHVQRTALSLRFLGERIDILVGGDDPRHHGRQRAQSDAAAGHQVVRHWVHTGPALAAPGVPLSEVVEAGLDPLAVRLAYLEHHYRDQANLTWDRLRDADRGLRRWRARVAGWAESPSAPMASGHVQRVKAALDDDLDTPTALALLRDLEHDESVTPGSRFESFLHLDRILALDLSTDIGRA
ncbi:cysteine--tRNA ligase [Nonomuraea lactucae]|uniref:cysteine--tRNA ligase n=1 Tax=Nonomuraea lactucae TaxID=2249762 RepID=UPI000DE250BF|nr:cysteine--tRNA ligase [Nonomuraea lactucae]